MIRSVAKDVLHVVLVLHVTIWLVWLVYAFGLAPSPPERDWFVLREVGKSFLARDWTSVYVDRQVAEGTMFFRYPPFVLYLLAPLAAVPPMVAYAMVCAVQLAAAMWTLVLLFRIRKPKEPDLVIAAAFGSAAMAHVIVTGHSSALLALVIAAAAFFWTSGRNIAAGLCVGLLACKPNWLPVFGLVTLWRGGLRAGAASALVGIALIVSTLPLPATIWRDFLIITTRSTEIETRLPGFKEITLLAALRSILGWGTLTVVVWGVAAALLTWIVIRAVRDTRPLGRALGLLTLMAVVVNPYAHFYDGLVLMIPGVFWYAYRDSYPRGAWFGVGAWIAAYWIWDMAVFYYSAFIPALQNPRVSAAGILVAGWLVTEAVAGSHEHTARATQRS